MHDQLINLFITGTLDTLFMFGVSGLLAFLIGLPLAVVLVSTSSLGIYPSHPINQSLGGVVNLPVLLHF